MNNNITKKYFVAFIAACIVMIITLTNASAEDIYICNCSSLDTNGATYYLTQDIIDSHTSKCMNISANNITLNCQYHTIDGDDSTLYGIYATGITNVTIKNCVLSDWSSTNLYLHNSNGNTIENVTSSSSSHARNGFHLYNSNHNTIINSTATDNRFGFYLLYSNNNIITDSTANSNNDGIYLYESDFNLINNSIIEDNSRWGICFGGITNTIYNNLFNNSVNYKIYGYYVQSWNTTRQIGDRIYSGGTEIGGNYWTNASKTGYSDVCIDADNDGFCDNPYILLTDQPCNNTDYLPLSDEYLLPDLTLTSIDAYHYKTTFPYPSWLNLSNVVEVIIENSGTNNTKTFNVSLYSNDLFIDKKTVPGLDTGNSTTLYFDWIPVGCDCADGCGPETFTLKAIADCDDNITESNENNNELTHQETAYWIGYAADEPLDNVAHDKFNGGLLFTTGDSRYGRLNPGNSRTGSYDISLPRTAQVELAKLNVYYTWTYPEGTLPQMEIEITNQTGTYILSPSRQYNDRKCSYGYDLYWGNWVYDVTQYIQENGTYEVSVKCTQSSGYVCPAGPGILILYRDETKPLIEYWLNEGADILEANSGYIYPWEAITNASFRGCIDDNVINASLGIVNPWANTRPDGGELFFNNISLGKDVYSGGMGGGSACLSNNVIFMEIGSGSQVAISLNDVKEYLNNYDNYAGIGDICDTGMMPSNAFLFVEYGNDTIPPNVTDHSPEGDDIWAGSPIVVIFSEVMNETSTEEAYSIVPDVEGTFEWLGRTMTFTPGDNLIYNTTYNVTISTGAKDRAGNNLEALYNWEFITQDIQDTTPPNVTAHSPTGVNVSIYSDISVTFSEAMNHTSTQSAFSITPGTTGTFTWNETTMTFSPDVLEFNTTYNITIIAASASDLTGNTLDGNNNTISEGSPVDDYSWQFTTQIQGFKSYDYDGFPITTKNNGTINGGVFISYGDNDRMENAKVKPYVTNISVPNGTPVWARLYMHLWGGNPYNHGTVNVTFNGHNFSTVVIEGKQTSDPHVLGSGCGTWWIFFNVTDIITPGDINRAQASVTSMSLDGRVARIVLVEVYEGGDDPQNIMYWINDGHMNLHYNSSEYPWCIDYTKAWFNGTVPSNVTEANLTGMWLTGSYGEPDYIYFSPPDESDAPNGENLNWNISKYTDYQFGAYDPWTGNMSYNDVAIGGGYSTNYFDIHSNTTTKTSTIANILKDDNNYAIFWRGHDNNGDGWIYGSFGGGGDVEGEGYVHNVFSSLVLNLEEEDITPPYTDGYDPVPGAVNVSVDTNITVHVKDSGAGVNMSTVVMKVNNLSVTPGITGTPADYELIYDPFVDFNLSETVNVSLYACDLNNNCMPEADFWEFTTESGPVVDCGDVDGENGVTIGDGIQVAMYTIYGPEQYPLTYPWAADVDCENGITIGDGIQIAMSTIYGTGQYPLECC